MTLDQQTTATPGRDALKSVTAAEHSTMADLIDQSAATHLVFGDLADALADSYGQTLTAGAHGGHSERALLLAARWVRDLAAANLRVAALYAQHQTEQHSFQLFAVASHPRYGGSDAASSQSDDIYAAAAWLIGQMFSMEMPREWSLNS